MTVEFNTPSDQAINQCSKTIKNIIDNENIKNI